MNCHGVEWLCKERNKVRVQDLLLLLLLLLLS